MLGFCQDWCRLEPSKDRCISCGEKGGIRALGVVPSFLASCFVAQTGVKIRRVITLKSDAEPADEDP
jgi:hypothetical protein